MACCALKKQKKQLLIFPIILFILSAAIGGSIVILLSLGGLFSRPLAEKKTRSWDFLKKLLNGLTTKILDQPFLFDSRVRCKLSGRMMRFSIPMAGAVYKYFNLIILTALLLSLFGLFQGVRALGI